MLKKRDLLILLGLTICGWGYTALGTGSTHAASAGTLTTQDYIDIEQNYARYYQTMDAGDLERWADTFTDDGNFNGAAGRAGLIESRRQIDPSKARHFVSNLVIAPTAEGAKGSVYVFVVDRQEVPLKIRSYSRYDDTLVKTSKGWRFKVRMRSSDSTYAPRPQQ